MKAKGIGKVPDPSVPLVGKNLLTLCNIVYTLYMIVFKNPLAFEWDEGNKDKIFIKHKVANEECEEVFFDTKKKIAVDILHSDKEDRYILLGKTKNNRHLFLVFTIRKDKIRIVSARDLSKKERTLYEKEN